MTLLQSNLNVLTGRDGGHSLICSPRSAGRFQARLWQQEALLVSHQALPFEGTWILTRRIFRNESSTLVSVDCQFLYQIPDGLRAYPGLRLNSHLLQMDLQSLSLVLEIPERLSPAKQSCSLIILIFFIKKVSQVHKPQMNLQKS